MTILEAETFGVNDDVKLHHGDCIEVMKQMPDNSVDAIVTDPPYGLGFMGKEWDALPPGKEWAEECLRVLKPGGHLIAFGGSRTWHRLAVAVEDAGFEIRDSIAWLYGSGFPKSLDVAKAMDKAGASSDEAKKWEGWGTALKPAFEPIVVGRKPFNSTVAVNVLKHGTGVLNIEATRTGASGGGGNCPGGDLCKHSSSGRSFSSTKHAAPKEGERGRWPMNVVVDETQAEELGEAAKFFPTFKYQAKPSKKERSAGLNELPDVLATGSLSTHPKMQKTNGEAVSYKNFHPTVKPLELMRWLVRLVTPEGGTVLEPFAGSGTTAVACVLEGKKCIAIEMTEDYLPIIRGRVKHALKPEDN